MSDLPLLFACWISTASAGFEVELHEDIVQQRDVLASGQQVVELVRILPPQEQAWTLVVRVPDAWVERPRSSGRDPGQIAAPVAPQISALVSAVRRDLPASSGLAPVEAAGLWAGLLRNSAYANPRPVSHYDQVLEPWEVLYDARAGDTLSSAFSALLALDRLGVDVSLARYPSPSTGSGVAFGLLLEGVAPVDVDWAWPVAGVTPEWTLLPLHLKAKPTAALSAEQVDAWSLAEVTASGWDPGAPEGGGDAVADAEEPGGEPDGEPDGEPETDPEPPAPAPPPPPPRKARPDICVQAEAMGLSCRPVDRSNDPAYLLLSLVALAALLAGAGTALAARARRERAVKGRRSRRASEDF